MMMLLVFQPHQNKLLHRKHAQSGGNNHIFILVNGTFGVAF